MPAGTDAGYLFLGPRVEKRSKKLKEDNAIVAYHQSGGGVGSMVAQRNDDHYMLRSAIRWRIDT